MGSKDVRHREPKKQKKERKGSIPPVSVTSHIAEPEVARKKRPPREKV